MNSIDHGFYGVLDKFKQYCVVTMIKIDAQKAAESLVTNKSNRGSSESGRLHPDDLN